MPEDVSLDQFLNVDDESDESEGDEPVADEPSDGAGGTAEEDHAAARAAGGDAESGRDPARTTYRFDPDGGVCEACGETVRARWRGEGETFVCNECKSW